MSMTIRCKAWRLHSTPDPGIPPEPKPVPVPDDVPAPANAPVQEPKFPEPPVKMGKGTCATRPVLGARPLAGIGRGLAAAVDRTAGTGWRQRRNLTDHFFGFGVARRFFAAADVGFIEDRAGAGRIRGGFACVHVCRLQYLRVGPW